MRRLAMEFISNEDLDPRHFPPSDGPWKDIARFALTFNGYEALGQRLGELANGHAQAGTLPVDLTELRSCLFFEQRRWRQFDAPPHGKPMEHILRLLEAIRAAVANR